MSMIITYIIDNPYTLKRSQDDKSKLYRLTMNSTTSDLLFLMIRTIVT